MPAGDPAGYLPNARKSRKRKLKPSGLGKSPYKPYKLSAPGTSSPKAKLSSLPPESKRPRRKRSRVYMPRPDGPLVGPYRRRNA
jgi:hypothetical protein